MNIKWARYFTCENEAAQIVLITATIELEQGSSRANIVVVATNTNIV